MGGFPKFQFQFKGDEQVERMKRLQNLSRIVQIYQEKLMSFSGDLNIFHMLAKQKTSSADTDKALEILAASSMMSLIN